MYIKPTSGVSFDDVILLDSNHRYLTFPGIAQPYL
jgi:hypothetical protein